MRLSGVAAPVLYLTGQAFLEYQILLGPVEIDHRFRVFAVCVLQMRKIETGLHCVGMIRAKNVLLNLERFEVILLRCPEIKQI